MEHEMHEHHSMEHEMHEHHEHHNHSLVFELPRVLDAQVDDRAMETFVLAYENLQPAILVPPFTFVGCRNINQEPTLSNITLMVNPEDEGQLIVEMDIEIDLLLGIRDINNVNGTAEATIIVHEAFLVDRPMESKFPFSFAAMVAAQCAGGSFADDGSLAVNLCLLIIVKMVVDVLVRIPIISIEPPRPMNSLINCDRFFDLPTYPDFFCK